MQKETLKYVLAQSAKEPLPLGTPRTLELPLDSGKVVALIGIRRSGKTFLLWLSYLEESFVVFTLPVAERSLRKQAMNPKKLHAIDWALAYPFVVEPTIDVGKKLETAVFLHWRRRREDLGYLAGDREVDLVVNREQPEQLINIAYSVSKPSTWEREIAALEEAGPKFPHATRVLVAHEHTPRQAPAGIEMTDAWRYLLET